MSQEYQASTNFIRNEGLKGAYVTHSDFLINPKSEIFFFYPFQFRLGSGKL